MNRPINLSPVGEMYCAFGTDLLKKESFGKSTRESAIQKNKEQSFENSRKSCIAQWKKRFGFLNKSTKPQFAQSYKADAVKA